MLSWECTRPHPLPSAPELVLLLSCLCPETLYFPVFYGAIILDTALKFFC